MIIKKFKNWLWPENFPKLSAWDRCLRQICRFIFIFFTEFKRDRINLRAAALTYSVVLSLVPMLALSTAILKGMGAGNQMHQAAYTLIDNLDESSKTNFLSTDPHDSHKKNNAAPSTSKRLKPTINTDDNNLSDSDSAIKAESQKDFSAHLYAAVDKVFAYVNRTNFAALGIIGTFLLLITVLIVINGIEEALNAIWQVDKSRSPSRKFMNYMALIIICPLTINLGIGATTMLNTPAIAKHLDKFFPIVWVQGILFRFIPILLLTLTFVLFYYFLPNIKIRAKAAWTGGLAGALGLITLQKIFILLQVGVANYNAIYGSFATVPLFLLWVHSAWLVFLAGSEIAFITQHFQNYHSQGRHLPPGPEMVLTFNLINEIYTHFNQRQKATLKQLATATRESTIAVEYLLKRLIKAGLVLQTKSQPPLFVPVTPAEKLKAEEITNLLWQSEEAKAKSLGQSLALSFLRGGNQALPDTPWGTENQTATDTCSLSKPGGE